MAENSCLVVGTSARNNWDIIRESEPGHLWFHLDSFPSPHVILRSNEPSRAEIECAASLCKSRSRYRKVRNVRVVYTRVHNLDLADEVGAVDIVSKKRCEFITPRR